MLQPRKSHSNVLDGANPFEDVAGLLEQLGRGRMKRPDVLVESLERLQSPLPLLVVPPDRPARSTTDVTLEELSYVY